MTFASLSLLGKMPVQRDWLIILLSGQETLSVISFNSFDDILSYPELDLGFNWPIILAISVGLVYWNKKELEQGVFRYESKGALFAVLIERARSGPMLVKYSLLAKIYNFGKYVRLTVCLFVCLFVCVFVCLFVPRYRSQFSTNQHETWSTYGMWSITDLYSFCRS